MTESDKEHIFLRKIAKEFEPKDNTGSRVQYITNVDCQTKMRVGPTWMKPSTYSQNLLHDGFLYGMENENGEMTGYLNLNGLISFPMTRKLGRVALVRGRHVSRTRLFFDGQMDHEKHFA